MKHIVETVAKLSSSLFLHSVYVIFSSFAAIVVMFKSSVLGWHLWIVIGFGAAFLLLEIVTTWFISSTVSTVYLRSAVLHITVRKISKYRLRGNAAVENIALSITYLNHLKADHISLKMALLLATVIFVAIGRYLELETVSSISLVPLIPLALIMVQEIVVEYRIRNGLFGSNAQEAKAMIEFMVRNAEDIDFTDGNGKLREVLMPSAKNIAETTGFVDQGVGV